jgi:hypothetical protein
MLAAVKGLDLPKTDADGKFWAGPIAGKPDYSIDFSKAGLVDQEFKCNPERDGNEITVVMRPGSAVEGVVMDVATKQITPLTPGLDPAWAPDGSKLVFAGGDGLFVIAPNGANRTRLTTGAHRAPAWRP